MIKTDAGTKYISKKEVCSLLDISPATLNRMIAARAIPYHKIKTFTGGKYRVLFEHAQIMSWLEARIKPCLN